MGVPPRKRVARRLLRVAAWTAGSLAALAVLLAGAAVWLDHAYPPDLTRYLDRSTVVLDRDGHLLRSYTARDGIWRIEAGVEDVSPLYLDILMGYEDRRFREHPGVDPLAVLRAIGQWIVAGRPISGASTLTMQTVRLLEPRQRTLGAKLIEMARALQLEWHYGKDEILGMYLTLAPFGGNIEGVRAASLAYFGREPATLTPGEAALLVALPQSPARTRPDRDPEAARQARDKVLERMGEFGILSARQVADALQQAVPDARRALPFLAPHAADRLVAAHPGEAEIHTTIDGSLQATLEDVAARTVEGLSPRANLAILVIDNATREVRGYVGSAGFFSDERAGQIDLARALRSPGSTLKPFIYGMAFEDLLIHPETIVRDTPQRFGDYAPVNFDPVFSGEITVREALVRSVNVPAVAVLNRLGPPRLAARLRAAGGPLVLPAEEAQAGLPIALGGAGMTLWDLATLYAGLANQGASAPLALDGNLDPAAPRPSYQRLLSPMAAWYVTGILADAAPPAEVMDPTYAQSAHRIAYKTGTSYGFRDAWAVGYDARHTVAVWAGRPDGSPSPDRYGRNTAAPLLFRVFDLLPGPSRDVLGPAPEGVLMADNAHLPARLQRFDPPLPRARMVLAGAAEPPSITFPVNGTDVEMPGDILPLVATGGRRPLQWLVNGRPIPSTPVLREAAWQPDGPGRARITVIDANGQTASAEIWLR